MNTKRFSELVKFILIAVLMLWAVTFAFDEDLKKRELDELMNNINSQEVWLQKGW